MPATPIPESSNNYNSTYQKLKFMTNFLYSTYYYYLKKTLGLGTYYKKIYNTQPITIGYKFGHKELKKVQFFVKII